MDDAPFDRRCECWSEVHAQGRAIRYMRSGTGRTVLLLGVRDMPTLETLVDPLAAWFRLIVPDPPREGGDGPDWIEALIDGLGAAAVGIVAAGSPMADAWALATRDPDRVRRLVLIGDLPAPAPAGGPGGLEGPSRRVHILNPALLADGRGLAVITGFLAESAATESLDSPERGSLS